MPVKTATHEGLEAAARALDAMAAGTAATPADVVSGALAMDTLLMREPDAGANRDLNDAKLGLESLATGGEFELDAQGRVRAAHLAKLVRQWHADLIAHGN